MNQKPVTIIVSDLHLGGGKADAGDDHVYQGAEFSTFLAQEIPESEKGNVELFINGDFLEFAQVKPEVYTLGSPHYWCSEDESLAKLEVIISGHANIFAALRDFKDKGNKITIAAGNHDVDVCWVRVQERLKELIGEIEFALGQEWFYRYDMRLVIGHGHMVDPANTFKQWQNPILKVNGGPPRLEMCPGTLFMTKFVNWLEKQYPFADNVKPITALARVLYAERRADFKVAVWTLLRFIGKHPSQFLGDSGPMLGRTSDIGQAFVYHIHLNEAFARDIVHLYHEMGKPNATLETVRKELGTDEDMFHFLTELLVKIEPDRWLPVFRVSTPSMLGIGDHNRTTLSIIRAGGVNEKENLRLAALSHFTKPGHEVVVCGHTHQPDEWRGPNRSWDGGYFNPGSWTRSVDMRLLPQLTLDDLQREEDFPYQLNYIRVEESPAGRLRSEKICYKYANAKWSAL